jgi:hypothetical protein
MKKKKCSRCKEIKKLDHFSPCKTGKHGVYNYCKECRNKIKFESNPNRQIIDEEKAKRAGLKRQGLKRCSSCFSIFPLSDFYSDHRHSDGKQSICIECWKQKNNSIYMMREYGITLDQYYKLLDAQDGVCAICHRPPKNYRFNVDHDHNTHKIRALLCVNCNTNILPYVEDFPEWVSRAFEYLKNPPAFSVIGEIVVPETNQSRKKVNR